ncbi:uncharacterized protein CG13380-like [Drosophila serrata]|uniref:uncharacterized protein CG13380-like n=1 Tax=Drosophila serrata TaxID=7274 RepID=UPI000A1D342C|nr:uncharacterized protein CG13380-like [Drosophila serrata]
MEFQKIHNFSNYNLNTKCVEKLCICERKRDDLIVCSRCNQSFVGRLSQPCPKHPEVIFLMDARQCAFCGAHSTFLKVSKQ